MMSVRYDKLNMVFALVQAHGRKPLKKRPDNVIEETDSLT